MKKERQKAVLRLFLVFLNLAAAAVLTAGAIKMGQRGYSLETWGEILKGRSWVETSEYEQKAAGAVFDAMSAAAQSSRMERNGEYDPDRIIRIRDYLDGKTVYDLIPEDQKKEGICYRFGDLYQWSLKGINISQDILSESYRPLFYGSVQEYANECDEEYNTVVSQIAEAMEVIQKDVAEYQQMKKSWSAETVNVRYALWDLGNGNVYTNVPELQKNDIQQEELENFFYRLGSYYSFDSRSVGVTQKNTGEYYSYNTHALLTDMDAHLTGEYQIYVGIDTAFPVTDSFALEERAYEEAGRLAAGLITGMTISMLILLCSCSWLLWKLAGYISGFLAEMVSNAGMAVRVCILFVGYEGIQILLWLFLGKGAFASMVLLLCKLAVLTLLIWDGVQRQKLLDEVKLLAAGEQTAPISAQGLFPGNHQMAEAVNNLGNGLRNALQEQMKSERMKAALITNVSHDLKTPLTSIINYVDLMKRERIDSPKAQEYLEVLDQKSQRLKQLTEDLVEASRASSGNVVLDMQRIDLKELLMQTSGEFEERFDERGLKLIADYPRDPLYVEADGRRLWRIIENLYRNVEKYAMPYTRVYLELKSNGEQAVLSMKNISEQPLNISAEELTERFTRGDESRSTDGSGLGLSIAKDLTELQKGTFTIYLDGDLFKVTVMFPWKSAPESVQKGPKS